ncbi:hypothetical protein P7K49_023949, partial [Saguinus oedipus]
AASGARPGPLARRAAGELLPRPRPGLPRPARSQAAASQFTNKRFSIVFTLRAGAPPPGAALGRAYAYFTGEN